MQENPNKQTCIRLFMYMLYFKNCDETVIELVQSMSAQSVGVVEYTGCISVEEYDYPFKCLGYYIKLSDGEDPVLEFWAMWILWHYHYSQVHADLKG